MLSLYIICNVSCIFLYVLFAALALGARVVVFCSVSVTESTIDSAQARMESYKSISNLRSRNKFL